MRRVLWWGLARFRLLPPRPLRTLPDRSPEPDCCGKRRPGQPAPPPRAWPGADGTSVRC